MSRNKKTEVEKKSVNIKMYFSPEMTDDDIKRVIEGALQEFSSLNNKYNDVNTPILESKGLKEDVKTLLKLPFISRDKINGSKATMTLLSSGISLVFWLVYAVLFLLAIACILGYPIIYVWILKNPNPPTGIPSFIAIGVVLYIFSGIFRMASIEVGKMKNNDSIINLFAALMALIAVIIALVVK